MRTEYALDNTGERTLIVDKTDDVVNHPSHYRGFSNGAEVIDIVERLNFNRGNAIKYIARAGRKQGSSTIEDLQKAEWYLRREIQRILADGKEVAPSRSD